MTPAVLVLALWALAVAGFAVAFTITARRDRAARKAARRGARIEVDRALIAGDEPLPPGTDVSRAWQFAARHDMTMREAAVLLHTREIRALLRRRLDPHPLD